jgi:hypothetical protein
MQNIKLTLEPTLQQARSAAMVASSIARAYYCIVTGNTCPPVSRFVQAVELSVGEACTNSIQHRPERKRGNVLVTFEFDQDSFSIVIRDRNEQLDFDSIPPPDLTRIQESGYGLHIIKSAMDDTSYERVDGWNILSLRKSCPMEV